MHSSSEKKTSKKKAQSVRPKATRNTHNKLIKWWWFQESSQEEETLQQRQENKKFWVKYYTVNVLCQHYVFILTQNQYTFVSTECRKVPLQYQQYIRNQISLDELKAAKCEAGTSDEIHEAQPSTSNEGNMNTQPQY